MKSDLSYVTDIMAIRIPFELRSKLPMATINAYVKSALEEKLERDSEFMECPRCCGVGKVPKTQAARVADSATLQIQISDSILEMLKS